MTCSRPSPRPIPVTADLVHVGHIPTVAYLVSDLCEDPKAADRAMRDGYPLCGVAILEPTGATFARSGCRLTFFGAPSTEAA